MIGNPALNPLYHTDTIAVYLWLIVAVTILFTAFPAAFAVIATGLHIPLSLMLIGIVIRGTAFAVRTHDITSRTDGSSSTPEIWRSLFAGSSLVTPALLGVSLGTIASGRLTGAFGSSGSFTDRFITPWLSTFPLSVGLLTTAMVAYLAAVYLLVECKESELRELFKRRALAAGCMVFLFAAYALHEARNGAPEIYQGLRHTALGLAAIGLEPVLAGLLEEELNRCLVLRRNLHVLEEEAAAVEVERFRRARHIFLGLGPFLYPLIFFRHPGIQPLARRPNEGQSHRRKQQQQDDQTSLGAQRRP